ncbi:MAG: hypothetical protein AAF914_01170 [Pseudomonadota bacterium]
MLRPIIPAIVFAALPCLALAGGHGQFLDCTGAGVSFEIERGGDFCYVDGTPATLTATEPSFVCDIAEPESVLTIADDLSFSLESAAGDAVTGQCTVR